MPLYTTLFLVALFLGLTLQWWLAQRHIAHIVRHRGEVPAPFREKISAAAHRKAADYSIAKTKLHRIEAVVGAAILLAFTLGGGLDRIDAFWRAQGFGPVATGAGFMLSAFFLLAALDIPFELYRVFRIEAHFGFNKMTPALYLADVVKKTLLTIALGAPLIAAALWLMQAMGANWWWAVWLLWVAFSLTLLWAYPAFIAPLFNRFRPLTESDLAARVQQLLARCGFQSRGIFVMDGSRRSAHGNAYFTGLGRNKRIVFFDTLLETLEPPEIEAVLAHELGHFKRRHVIKRIVFLFGFGLAGLALLNYLMQTPSFYAAFGLSVPSTHAALTLFVLVTPVFTFYLQPLFAWSSRRHEFEADAYAAQQADAAALRRALVKLYEDNAATLTPDPLHSAFYDSHPPASVRIARLATSAPT